MLGSVRTGNNRDAYAKQAMYGLSSENVLFINTSKNLRLGM